MLMIFIKHFIKDKTFIMRFFKKKEEKKKRNLYKNPYQNIKHFRHSFAFNTVCKIEKVLS